MTPETKPLRSANYSPEEREKIISAVKDRPKGQSIRQRCRELQIPEGTVSKWISIKRPPTPVFTKPKGKANVRVIRPVFMPLPKVYNW